MNILIYDKNSWLGTQFISILKLNNVKYFLSTSLTVSEEELLRLNPTHMISFLEKSALELAILSNKYNIHFTYFGKDDEFNYENILKIYIRQLVTVEKHPNNLITKLITEKKRSSKQNSISLLPDLLPIVYDLMKKNRCGIINLVNPGLISTDEILEMYNNLVDPSFSYKDFTYEEEEEKLDILNTEILEKLYPEIENIKICIRRYLLLYSINRNKITKYSLKYYLIHNLDPEREKIMNNEFEKWKFDKNDIIWINHPNKNEITDDMVKLLTIQTPSLSCGILVDPSYLPTKKGIISCTYKHYLALNHIVQNNYDYGVIMEDNIIFLDEIPKLVNIYIEQLNNIYKEWDIVFDGCWTRYIESPIKPNLFVYPKSNEITYQCHGSTKTATFYIIKQECAKKLLPHYIPYNAAPDWWMNDLFRKLNIKSYWIEPSRVRVQEGHVSTTNI